MESLDGAGAKDLSCLQKGGCGEQLRGGYRERLSAALRDPRGPCEPPRPCRCPLGDLWHRLRRRRKRFRHIAGATLADRQLGGGRRPVGPGRSEELDLGAEST